MGGVVLDESVFIKKSQSLHCVIAMVTDVQAQVSRVSVRREVTLKK